MDESLDTFGLTTNCGTQTFVGISATLAIILATSTGSTILALSSSEGGTGHLSKAGVLTSPGIIAVARIRLNLYSAFINSVKLIIADFVAP